MSTTLFGANGVRGIVNQDLTPEVALKLGKAVGRTFPGTIAVATDARDSAPAVKAGVVAGMMAVGVHIIDLGMVPTPALQMYVRDRPDVDGGVMITASHNPGEYNGLKLIMQDGIEATREDEQSLEVFFSRDIETELPRSMGEMRIDDSAARNYVDAVLSHVDAEAIRAAGLTVCLDCAGGVASITSPMILKRLGVKTVAIGSDPVGTPHRESDPSEENLEDLKKLVPALRADLGIGHDGDGGRAVFVDSEGNYLNGDVAGAIVAKSILGVKKGKVVTPVSSSQVLEDVVEANGGLVKYTEVGTHVIVHKIIENMAILGVEEHGGMIFPDHQLCRDGGMAMAKMLEIVAKNGSLRDQVAALPRYYTVKRRIACPDAVKAPLMDWFHKELDSDSYRIDLTDGLKVYCDDGWILLRPSTTEECFRVYADSSNLELSESRADEASEKVGDFVSNFSPGSSREPRGPR